MKWLETVHTGKHQKGLSYAEGAKQVKVRHLPGHKGWDACEEHETAAAAANSLQSRPTLCNAIDGSLPGSSVHGIFQARVLEWGATAFSDTPTQTHFPIVSWEF